MWPVPALGECLRECEALGLPPWLLLIAQWGAAGVRWDVPARALPSNARALFVAHSLQLEDAWRERVLRADVDRVARGFRAGAAADDARHARATLLALHRYDLAHGDTAIVAAFDGSRRRRVPLHAVPLRLLRFIRDVDTRRASLHGAYLAAPGAPAPPMLCLLRAAAGALFAYRVAPERGDTEPSALPRFVSARRALRELIVSGDTAPHVRAASRFYAGAVERVPPRAPRFGDCMALGDAAWLQTMHACGDTPGLDVLWAACYRAGGATTTCLLPPPHWNGAPLRAVARDGVLWLHVSLHVWAHVERTRGGDASAAATLHYSVAWSRGALALRAGPTVRCALLRYFSARDALPLHVLPVKG